jgi:hypothetical protein
MNRSRLLQPFKLFLLKEIQGQLTMCPEIFKLQKKKILIILAFVVGISIEYLV